MSESPGIEQDTIEYLHDYKADRRRLEMKLDENFAANFGRILSERAIEYHNKSRQEEGLPPLTDAQIILLYGYNVNKS